MVEIPRRSKERQLVLDYTETQRRSPGYPVKRKLMTAGSGIVLKGFALGMALGGLTSGPPAIADQLNWRPEPPPPLTVPKASCGRRDHPETALQGQVPAYLRAFGFQGF